MKSIKTEDLKIHISEPATERGRPAGSVAKLHACCLWQTTLSQRRNLNATVRLQDTLGQELTLANKQLLMARRAALRALLEAEHRRWQRELGEGGRARFVERL
ncbi:uncharacterized protein C1orf189 homolog [Enhydra lutris kenyoni]|uniref:Uncharacterized protein C1orf189 homolog n=1 Tax=Enhydra lutris kenyoni TaxID=391180 RepID=A0A2Y9IK36_ENHLU|nr:uncharacterized protein C1orf189 homolog [Enhydra lutris kenyoni]